MNRLCKYLPRPVLTFLMLQHTSSQAPTLFFVLGGRGFPLLILTSTPTILTVCFVVFLSSFSQVLGWYLELGHEQVFLHPCCFIIHYHPLIQHCIVGVTDTVIK
jgi:hypothetical protein